MLQMAIENTAKPAITDGSVCYLDGRAEEVNCLKSDWAARHLPSWTHSDLFCHDNRGTRTDRLQLGWHRAPETLLFTFNMSPTKAASQGAATTFQTIDVLVAGWVVSLPGHAAEARAAIYNFALGWTLLGFWARVTLVGERAMARE